MLSGRVRTSTTLPRGTCVDGGDHAWCDLVLQGTPRKCRRSAAHTPPRRSRQLRERRLPDARCRNDVAHPTSPRLRNVRWPCLEARVALRDMTTLPTRERPMCLPRRISRVLCVSSLLGRNGARDRGRPVQIEPLWRDQVLRDRPLTVVLDYDRCLSRRPRPSALGGATSPLSPRVISGSPRRSCPCRPRCQSKRETSSRGRSAVPGRKPYFAIPRDRVAGRSRVAAVPRCSTVGQCPSYLPFRPCRIANRSPAR